METVDEVQNRIESLKLMNEGEKDRISELPDCLLVEILSHLPSTKEAIITGTLSKRWKHVWTWVHTLIFSKSNYSPPTVCPPNRRISPDFVSCVDKTLTQCRQLKLKKFQVGVDYGIQLHSRFNNWIRYAVSCNVEELRLDFGFDEEPEVLLDEYIFTGSCFTDLTLGACILNPSGPITWQNLRNLSMSYVKIDEDLMENVLSGSPLLETLELHECYGYKRLDITSKSVKKLVFDGYSDLEDEDYVEDLIKVNAPNILSLSIEGDLMVSKVLLVNVSSLIQAKLNYEMLGHYEPPGSEDMLKGFVLNLRHVKELKIGPFCCRVLCGLLEDKGFTLPSNVKLPSDRSDSDWVWAFS